ncbi:MAG: (d)CMP kinase [Candidatus Cloacimonetes bacterium]|nr:(d)CMP kinase [Candidatus Cloacimonadota bacterium]
MEIKRIIVAIDGPASSGKSTTAKRLAKKLNCIYVDSGAMYRAVALFLLQNKIDFIDKKLLRKALSEINIEIVPSKGQGENKIILNGVDVSKMIREPEITDYSSTIATESLIRQRMVELQRKMAETQSIVMDGRDIGTVVFPQADFKFFLVASIDERARRRWQENQQKGLGTKTPDEIKHELAFRDKRDSTRKIAPLKKAKDAIEIDTTNLSIQQQVDEIFGIIKDEIFL